MSERRRWTRKALIEGPIIVFSILLAFAIDASWDVRGERLEHRRVLEGLREEYREHRATYAGHLRLAEQRLADIARLLTGRAAMDLGIDQIERSLFQLLTVNTVDPGQGVRDALVSSGKLELLDNVPLRLRLVEWEGVVEELRDKQNVMRELVSTSVLPYLATEDVPLARVLSAGGQAHPQWPEGLEWPAPPEGVPAAAAPYARILADGEFQSYVSTRYLWLAWSLFQLRAIVAEIEWTLAEVERELGS